MRTESVDDDADVESGRMRGTVETTAFGRLSRLWRVHGSANFTADTDLDYGPAITAQCSRAIFHNARPRARARAHARARWPREGEVKLPIDT